jgi:glycosyltransferase involved in cell wall biosynthesis
MPEHLSSKNQIAGLVSIVIPIHNEKDNITPLYEELASVLSGPNYEFIFSDDGSYDGSAALLDRLVEQDPRVRVIHFRRNFGQTAAMAAGFKAARGEVIVAMDGDMQNDPRDIPELVAKIHSGYDLVSGWRKNRQDKAFSRKLPSWLANRLIGSVTEVKIHDYGCTLKAYRASMLQHIDLYGEMHRFIPALAKTVGARITEVVVHHRARTRGQTKYGISRTFRVLLDLLTIRFFMRFQSRPLHFIGLPGLLSSFAGFAILTYLACLKLIWGIPVGHRPLLVISVLMIVAGIQFFGLGLLGEFLTRIYYSAAGREPYIIERIVESKNR